MSKPLSVEVAVFTDLALPLELDDDLMVDLVGFTLDAEGATGDWEVNLQFVEVDEMTRLHQQFMAIPEPTDILTFGFDHSHGGDIAICVPVSDEFATDHDLSRERELCFLVVHGVLHLVGHDDRTEDMRGAMLSRQDQILDQWGKVSR